MRIFLIFFKFVTLFGINKIWNKCWRSESALFYDEIDWHFVRSNRIKITLWKTFSLFIYIYWRFFDDFNHFDDFHDLLWNIWQFDVLHIWQLWSKYICETSSIFHWSWSFASELVRFLSVWAVIMEFLSTVFSIPNSFYTLTSIFWAYQAFLKWLITAFLWVFSLGF